MADHSIGPVRLVYTAAMGGNLPVFRGVSRGRVPSHWPAPLVLLVLSAASTAAEIRGAESIEWMVADSDVVVRARFHSGGPEGPDAGDDWWRLTATVVEPLRGPHAAGKTVTIRLPDPVHSAMVDAWRAVGDERLLFLVTADRMRKDRRLPGYAKYPHGPRRGAWFLCTDGDPAAWTMDFRRVSGWHAVCEAVRRAAAHRGVPLKRDPYSFRAQLGHTFSTTRGGAVRLWAPPGSEEGAAGPPSNAMPWALRQPFMVVPCDDRLAQLAHRWARERRYRAHAFPLLRCYDSPCTNDALAMYFDDPAHEVYGAGKAAAGGRGGVLDAFGTALGFDLPRRVANCVPLGWAGRGAGVVRDIRPEVLPKLPLGGRRSGRDQDDGSRPVPPAGRHAPTAATDGAERVPKSSRPAVGSRIAGLPPAARHGRAMGRTAAPHPPLAAPGTVPRLWV